MENASKRRFFLVRIGGPLFAVDADPVDAVAEARTLLAQARSGCILWGDRVVPLVTPHAALGLAAPRVGARSALLMVRQNVAAGPRWALLVDSVAQVERFPSTALAARRGGIFVRRMRRWVPVLDPLQVADSSCGRALSGSAQRSDKPVERESFLDVSPLQPDEFIHLSGCFQEPFKADAAGQSRQAFAEI